MNITGGHKFGGKQTYQQRCKKMSSLLNYLLSQHVKIDQLQLSYEPNHFGQKCPSQLGNKEPAEKPFIQTGDPTSGSRRNEDFTVLLRKSLFCSDSFLTSKMLYSQMTANKNVATARTSLSRIFGVTLGGSNLYPTYFITTEKEKWSKNVEETIKLSLQAMWINTINDRSLLCRKKSLHQQGEAIFYVPDFELLIDMLHETNLASKQGQVKPWHIYDGAYVLPMDTRALGIRQILTAPRWEEKLASALFTEAQREDVLVGDATVNGMPVFELLTCNVHKLITIKRLLSSVCSQLTVVAFPWQKEVLRSISKNNITIVPVDDAAFTSIIQYIREEK